MMVDPLINLFIRLGFALLFVLAGWHKLRDMGAFRTVLVGYQIVPVGSVKFIAPLIALFEWMLAVLLMTVPVWGVVSATCLLSVYALLMAFNIVRGITEIDCGCSWGGATKGPSLGWGQVGRNLVLIAVLLLALLPVSDRPLRFMDFLNLGFLLIFAAVALRTAQTLRAGWARMRRFGHV